MGSFKNLCLPIRPSLMAFELVSQFHIYLPWVNAYLAKCLTSDGLFAALHQADNYLKSNYNLFLIIFFKTKIPPGPPGPAPGTRECHPVMTRCVCLCTANLAPAPPLHSTRAEDTHTDGLGCLAGLGWMSWAGWGNWC